MFKSRHRSNFSRELFPASLYQQNVMPAVLTGIGPVIVHLRRLGTGGVNLERSHSGYSAKSEGWRYSQWVP